MGLSKTERLILSNQYKILALLEPKRAEEYEKCQEALNNGYPTGYPSLEADEMSAAEGKFVADVFQLYSGMQRTFGKLTDKAGIKEQDVLFQGFDGNNEIEYLSYATFLREVEGYYTDVALLDGLNSHMPSVGGYKRMLTVWNKMDRPFSMDVIQVQELIEARRFPER